MNNRLKHPTLRFAALLLVLTFAACSNAPMAGFKTIKYSVESKENVGDLYEVPGSSKPLIVLIHGGFWREEFKRDLMAPLANRFAELGYPVWNIEYRRVGSSGGGWPTTFQDVAAAVDHVATFPNRPKVITVGHSAGGQLALWAAARHRIASIELGRAPQVSPCAAVALSGVVDLALANSLGAGSDAVLALMGGSTDEFPERYTNGSPSEMAPSGVKTLLVHPPDDSVVPIAVSRSFKQRAEDQGDEVTLLTPPGDHFSVIDPDSEGWDSTQVWIDRACR